MSSKRFIYIVDDDEEFRFSLVLLLRAGGFEAVSFDSAHRFLESVRDLAHGCVLVDVRMPNMNGLELQKRLNDSAAGLPVIVITGQADIHTAVTAMKEGATDFIEKPVDAGRLFGAIESAFALSRRVRRHAEAVTAARRLSALSPRERQVLDALVKGRTAKMIAHDLGISARTVEVHQARMLGRLGLRRATEAVTLSVAASFGSL